MPVNPATQSVRLAVSDIISRFLGKPERLPHQLGSLYSAVTETFMPGHLDAAAFHGQAKAGSDLNWRDENRFFYLEPLDDGAIMPLLTVLTSNQWVHFRVYVLLAMYGNDDELEALALRFETDENGSQTSRGLGAHDYCHAQLCTRINGQVGGTVGWLPTSQPAFPLDAEDQVGLVICALISLYGGRNVLRRLTANGDRSLDSHLRRIRALHVT